MLIFL